MNKSLTLMEEAQIRADYQALPEQQRVVNENTHVSLMEAVKQTSAPDAEVFSDYNALLEDLGLSEFKDVK